MQRAVVCQSFDTKAGLPVVKKDAVYAPGFTFSARAIAALTASLFVTLPSLWKTTTFGGLTPKPNSFSVRWLVS